MSDYNNLLTNDQLLKENNRLLDIIAKLEVTNIDLTNRVIRLEKEKAEFESCTARVYTPNKSYKELEEKVAKADEIRKKDIDELWETKITPLQNKLKDQHTQIEALYKRENQHIKEIKDLKDTIHDAETVINFAVGYISATQPHTDKHPIEVKKWLYNGIFPD